MSLDDRAIQDLRVVLARPDLASADLEGVVRADRFVRAETRQVTVPVAALRRAPDAGAELMDEALFGERVDVAESAGDFAWAQARRDGYVGYVAVADLSALEGEPGAGPTHRVSALATYAFAEPRVQARPFGPLSMNVLAVVEEESGAYARVAGAGWIARRHLAPIGVVEDDFVAVAERYVGVPYLWGGRGAAGLDCSGLVLQGLYACGRACPRDTDQQAALGADADPNALARGDLVFWRGHVGIMLDAERLLHANAHHMAVGIEPLSEAVARIETAGVGRPTAYRRLGAVPGR